MTIYNLYFFNRKGTCLAYKEWCREKKSGISQEEEFKLVHGMLLSLRSFSHKLATRADQLPLVHSYRTSSYKMNYIETATGLKMVLNTDPDAIVLFYHLLGFNLKFAGNNRIDAINFLNVRWCCIEEPICGYLKTNWFGIVSQKARRTCESPLLFHVTNFE